MADRRRSGFFAVLLLLASGPWPAASRGAEAPPAVDFDRDIRPILSDKCFRCHGQDGAHRKAGLRLDRREEAVADRDGLAAIVPGKPDESEAYLRITAPDRGELMPPPESGLALSPREVLLLRRWIEQGAGYRTHWALVPPRSAPPPAVGRDGWSRNPIDRFVLAELERQGLEPSPEASRATLLRRVSLDLTGLPPSLEDVDAFLADPSPDAYEKAVDRLLGSPRYGERMALDWLDASRFADTNGYYTDAERHAWPWRDWVIDAYNRNVPFDRFTIEQVAGDLLPGATFGQRVATAFNRNHMVTNETGAIDEEFRVSYVADRAETTATVWLGLTLGCARCHDHKYDPISQADYYRFFAFFNQVPEKGLIKEPVPLQPVLPLPTAEQERRLALLREQRARCEARMRAAEPSLAAAMTEWEKTAPAELPEAVSAGNSVHLDFDRDGAGRGPRGPSARTVGRLGLVPGVLGAAANFDATQHVELDGPPALGRTTPFSFSAWIRPGSATTNCVVSRMDATDEARGFEVIWNKSQALVNLVSRRKFDAIEVATQRAFANRQWHHLAITYDGSGKAAGLSVYVDGGLQPLVVRRDSLSGPVATAEPWRVAWKGTGLGFEGAMDEVRLYDRPLGGDEVGALYWRDLLQGALGTARAERSKFQDEALRSYYLAHHAPADLRALVDELAGVRGEEEAVRKGIVAVPIMEEMGTPRETFILVRGQYDQRGARVAPGIPEALGDLPPDGPRNRLALARWLVGPTQPLTARVAVNRYWQLAFGEGLVRTANDFGLQGEPPSHPQLLDWLAVDFVRSGWDVKRLMRLLVTSATYRQTSNLTPALLARDPENRLLARGPRHRLPAELLRDQALAVGGLLAERVGGPSVRPYQPAGVWEAVSYNGDQSYVQDHGAALYRRGLYTFWKRQAPPPAMLIFDGPTRETCSVRRARTNTPLQGLVLLNDVTYVEAARGLAERMMREGGDDAPGRIRLGFRAATGRPPGDAEVAALERLYRQQRGAYRDRPQSARELLRCGEAPGDPSLDPCELAAWTMTASVLLNLDETITQH